MDDAATDVVERLNEALRLWYSSFHDLGRQFGIHLGMHNTDAAALLQITNAENRAAPFTQTQLARQIGLSATATSTLLSRLEDAGHIERIRSRKDRRVVTLRSTPQVHDDVQRFFEAVGNDLDKVTSRRPAEEIESFTDLLADMTGVLDRHLELLALADRPKKAGASPLWKNAAATGNS